MEKLKALLGVLLFCVGGLAVYGQSPPLKVEIKTAQTAVKNNEEFTLSATILNTGKDEQMFEVWSCGYLEWTVDNPSLQVVGEDCLRNIPYKVKLKPGESGHWEVPVRVELPGGSGQHESVTFRLGFQTATYGTEPEIPPIWSNALTVSVTR
jgi:hypothetical protein